jgi:hypothetical protein
MKYILEYSSYSNNKPIIEIINPTQETEFVTNPNLRVEADITGAQQAFLKVNDQWINWNKFTFDGKKFFSNIILDEDVETLIEIGAKSDKNEKGIRTWAKKVITYTRKPIIKFLNQKDGSIFEKSEISLEASVQNANKVSITLRGDIYDRKYYSFWNDKITVKRMFLKAGDNEIKIIAENQFGMKSESSINLKLKTKQDTIYSDEENSLINQIIREIVVSYWGNLYEGISIEKNGIVALTEYLRKWSNNRNFRTKLSEDFNLPDDANKFINCIIENKEDIFSPTGKYFKIYYDVLRGSSESGEINELIAEENFKIWQESLGNQIYFKKPSQKQDTYESIDLFAFINGKRFTIQVKPVKSVESRGDYYELFSGGDTRKVKTDFLVLASSKNCFIVRVPKEEFTDEQKASDITSIKTPSFEIRDSDKFVGFSKDLLLFEK